MDDEVSKEIVRRLKMFWNVQLLTNDLKIIFLKLKNRKCFNVVTDAR